MADLTLNTAYDFLTPQDWDWTVTQATATNVTITSLDGRNVQAFGGSFTYDAGGGMHGPVTSTSYYYNGTLVYSVTGVIAEAATLQQYAETSGDTDATNAYVLQNNDRIQGSSGADVLVGYAGNDTINGAAGSDAAVYRGNRADYVVSYNSANSTFTITDKTSGRDGSDQVSGVESFRFLDTTVSAAALAGPDTTAPTLTGSVPVNGAVGVSASGDLKLTFSEAIALGSGSITLRDADGNLVATYTASNTANLSVSGSTLTVHFSSPLAATTTYTLELGTGIVKDLAGNSFAGSSGYHFTTTGSGLTLTATASAPNLTGTNLDDTLIAGSGNGTLDGGAGNDVLLGGTGRTQMLGGSGNDTLISGSGGGDTMQGGDGADLYYVNSAGDAVIELASNAAQLQDPNHPADLGRALDKVIASITYTLTAFVENLSLAVGAGALSAIGNELANVITGNESNNTLVGNAGDDTLDGGAGADTMSGGSGADTYYVDNAGDMVTETAADAQADQLDPRFPDLGRSVDKVVAGISYTLTSFVENLTLAPATGNLAGSGNELNNELYGNEGNNSLSGKAGNDTLDGGAGLDTAQYSGKVAEYTIAQASGGLTVTDKTASRDGVDSLTNIERLKFSDGSLALDVGTTQAGGKAVLMMAVATSLGKDFVKLPTYAGLFLNYFDTGASLLDGAKLLVSSGIIAAFAGGADNASLVKMVYKDVYGSTPDAATLANLVAPLNAGSTSQAQWLADMAASPANQQHVGLTGYAGTGLQYV